ncbi:hypothetical protein [Bacillus altitudinis]|nr:hypothetical protein [Bacillus altitudinis]
MKVHEMIDKLAGYKQKEDYTGFKKFFESLSIDELAKLHIFSIELKNSC